MDLTLGIDTGGTYTDAVLVDLYSRKIISCAKALTTKENLFTGISSSIVQCIKGITNFSGRNINRVCLSTTLATNAITEGYGGKVCEILIGYNKKLLINQGFMKEMVTPDIVWLEGGHDLQGNPVSPLDEETAKSEIIRRSNDVEAFAVSGYFSTRNPAHELRIKSLVEQLTHVPVTCAHELTSRLNSVSRAITAGHNARLIPLLTQLISDVRKALESLDIKAPLMIVKGDGTITPATWAASKPIETILSGPAASSVGAAHLTGEKKIWLADMGGTTTDMALLTNGYPALHPEGAFVGNRRTMVEAVDIHTVGIGGDSFITLDARGNIVIGPRRVIPLCRTAQQHPHILTVLGQQATDRNGEDETGQFVMAWRSSKGRLSREDNELLSAIQKNPVTLISLTRNPKKSVTQRRIGQLEEMCLLHRSAFTPTDALHVLGKMDQWDKQGALLGAEILARKLKMDVTAFCEKVIKTLCKRLVRELVSKALAFETDLPRWEKEPTATAIFNLAVNNPIKGELSCHLKFNTPLVAIGAPVEAYIPQVASMLDTPLIIPEHAHVANAFGAATAGIIQRGRAVIRMMEGGRFFRTHLPDAIADFSSFQAAKGHAVAYMTSYVTQLAQKAGAANIKVETTCNDNKGKLPAGQNQEKFLDTELMVMAYGDPDMKYAIY